MIQFFFGMTVGGIATLWILSIKEGVKR